MTDEQYMQMALDLAQKGKGYVNPNPMVGAVIVKDGRIIGQGYHQRHGEYHAERNALLSCTEPVKGATMYVTLEPCCHYGKTPPCTEAIIQHGIKKVVIGSSDPNPLVGGKGAKQLRKHGIEVVEGVLKKECSQLNEVFFHYIQTKTPFVTMKYAMTMDGKIATHTGKSKWITGEPARRRVHEDRHKNMAIMVGAGTVLHDDPMLNCRIEDGKHPIRIVCDTRLRTPLESRLVKTAADIPVIIATAVEDRKRQAAYADAGCRLLVVPKKQEHIDLNELMNQLGEDGIDSTLLEGGGMLNWACLQSGIVQKVQAYIAPKIFGGENAKSSVEGLGIDEPSQAFQLVNSKFFQIGEDFLIESEVERNVHGNR